MWSFYWEHLCAVPRLLLQAGERLRTAVAVATFWLLVFNQTALGMTIWDSWHGISPWWCLVPLSWLIVHGLLKANYEAFAALERRVIEHESEELLDRRRYELGNVLDKLVADADQLYSDIFRGQAGSNPRDAVRLWSLRVRSALVGYGIEFEWRAIDAVSPLVFVVPAKHANFTGLLLEALEARKQRLLVTCRRCSRAAADRLNPTRAPVNTTAPPLGG